VTAGGQPKQRKSVIRPWRVARLVAAGLLGLVLVIILTVAGLLSSESGSRWVLGRVTALVSSLPGQQLTIGTNSGSLLGDLALENLVYSSDAVRVTVSRVELDWNPLSLLAARLSINELGLTGSRIELLSPAAEPGPVPTADRQGPLVSFTPLPVEIDVQQLAIEQLALHQEEQLFNVSRLLLAANLSTDRLTVSELAMDSDLVSVTGELTLNLRDNLPLQASLQWQYPRDIYPDSGPVAGTLSADGDLATLAIEHRLQQPFRLVSNGRIGTGLSGGEAAVDLTHSGELLTLSLEQTGEIRLENLTAATAGSMDRLQLSLSTGLGGQRLPSAILGIDGSWQNGSLTLDRYTVETATGQVAGSAGLTFDGGVSGSLRYQLTEATPLAYYSAFVNNDPNDLPIAVTDLRSTGSVEFSSADAAVTATLELTELVGELGEYPFTGSGQFSYANGTLQFDTVRLATSDNQLRVDGTLSGNLDFTWAINAPRLDQFMPGLEGRLTASGELAGTTADLQVDAQLGMNSVRYEGASLDRLSLDLQLQDDSLRGLLTVNDASYQSGERTDRLDSLDLQVTGSQSMHQIALVARSSAGNGELLAEGGFADLATLAWEGSLVRGQLETPLGDWRTRAASAISLENPAPGLLIDVEESCWLQGDASLCLSVATETTAGDPVMILTGALRDYPLAVLNHPVNRPPELSFQFDAIPQLPEAINLGGSLEGDFLVTVDPSRLPAVQAEVLPRDLSVTVSNRGSIDPEGADPDPEPEPIPHEIFNLIDPAVSANLAEGRWELLARTGLGRQATADGTTESGGALESRLALAADGVLEGAVRLDLENIGWLGSLVPDAGAAAGRLAGDLRVSGSLSEPVVGMSLAVDEGLVEIPRLGITVADISARIDSQQNGPMEIDLTAQSGDGSLQLQGRVTDPFTSGRQLSASLTGQNFEVAGLPDLGIALSPSLQVSTTADRIAITGDLVIPLLNVTLRELPEQAVDVSRDAIIVSHPPDRPELARSIAAEQGTLFNVPLVADVNISLGDNVSLNGFGFTSQVAGNLNVRQQANGTNLTYGELEIVRGDYLMYGQSLQIRGGKLLFFGAYDNPALDIRATRTAGDTTVGVLMNGTLKNIRSQLFSTPALPDSDIIAILATGRPFSEIGQGEGDQDAMLGSIARLGLNRSQGLTNQVREQLGLDTLDITNNGSINNTTLTVGKFITPDIFLRYGIGLFDHQSKLALDYTLTDRITLQAETGEYQSVDVIYRVER